MYRVGRGVGLMLGTNLSDPIDPILFVQVMRKVASRGADASTAAA